MNSAKKTMKPTPTIGQTLYSLNIGNAARRGPQVLTPMTVSKVGRKYFTITHADGRGGVEFHLDSWKQRTEYCEDHKLYVDPQEWEDERESRELCGRIWNAFEYGRNRLNVPLKSLREASSILFPAT